VQDPAQATQAASGSGAKAVAQPLQSDLGAGVPAPGPAAVLPGRADGARTRRDLGQPRHRSPANGVDVPSSKLDPDTEYEIVARIWNGSTDAPVPALPVRFSYLSFGIGVQSHPIGVTAVSLGVKGGPDQPASARMKWRTPATGHYCLQVQLEPVDDVNFGNNLGQENTEVGTAHSPVGFEFLLRNAGGRDEVFRFELDAYAIPELPPCDERPVEPPIRPAPGTLMLAQHPVPARHDRANHPVPNGWSVVLDPSEPRLAPEAETTVRVTVTPPDDFRGRQPLNVNAFDGAGFVGGVTFYVESA
jgi:hypothetical protein